MFGQSQKPGFGGTNAFGSTMNTFGSTSFGQNTTAFGAKTPAPAAFGTPTFGSSTPSVGIFRAQPASTPSASLFGSNATGAFGQPAATSTSTFGFGGSSSTGTNLFGTPQQQTGTNLFGSQSTSAFGTAKPTGFSGFGTNTSTGTSLFGQNKQTSIFGSSTAPTTGGIFGSTATTTAGSSLFSANTGFSATQTGTTVKFNPLTGNDTMLKNGVSTNINTRHQCITTMKEYESKSLEELRTEDYLANRKGPQAGSSFGVATPSSSLFGQSAVASTASFNFGAPQSKPLFGGTATSTPSLFGQPQQQSTSLFGQPATSGFGAATSTATGFGGFGTSTSGSTLFSQPAASQQSTGLFGQPIAQTHSTFGTPSFGSGFGATTQSNSLFGAKPAFGTTTTTSAFNFGTNTAPSTGGTSLFGQKPAGSMFSSGTTPAFGSTGTGFGGFGTASATSKPGGLFGAQNNTLGFNLTSTAPSFGANLSGGFGTGLGTSTGSSLFGNTTTAKPAFNFGSTLGTGNTFGTTSFGTGNTTLGAPAIGTGLTSDNLSQQQADIQKQLLALAATPFGDSPLFRNVETESGKREELLKPTNPAAQRALITANQFKVSPMPKVKPKSWNPSTDSKKSLFDGLEDDDIGLSLCDSFVPRKSVKKLILKSKSGNNSTLGNESAGKDIAIENGIALDSTKTSTPLPFSPVTAMSTSALKEKEPTLSSMLTTPDLLIRKYTNVTNDQTSANSKAVESIKLKENTSPAAESISNVSSSDLTKEKLSFNETTIDLDYENENDKSEMASPKPPHPAGIILNRVGYYTIPSLESLKDLTDSEGCCTVEDFTIGREGYGSVFYPGTTDVTGLNLDELVHIRRKEIIVYPEDSLKPAVGEGLNKKAEVTLDGIWPSDKTTREPIKVPEKLKIMKYPEKIERATLRMGAKFFEYRPETGSWLFQVQHFSKYGLEDSDDEVEITEANANTKKALPKNLLKQATNNNLKENENNTPFVKPIKPIPFKLNLENDKTTFLNSDMDMTEVFKSSQLQHSNGSFKARQPYGEDDEMEDITHEAFPSELYEEDHEDDMQFTCSHHLNRSRGINSQQLQIMKASFFCDEDDEEGVNDHNLQSSAYMESSISNNQAIPHSLLRSKVTSSAFSGVNKQPITSNEIATPTASSDQNRKRIHTNVYTFPDLISKHAKLPSGVDSIEQSHLNVSSRLHMSTEAQPSKSLLQGKNILIADSACFNGTRFRVGWAVNSTMCHSGVSVGTETSISVPERYNMMSMLSQKNPVQTSGKYAVKTEKLSWCQQKNKACESLLKISLRNSKCSESEISSKKCPMYAPNPGTDALQQYSDMNETTNSNIPRHLEFSEQVWKLCVALWGQVPGLEEKERPESYANRMARRRALSDWLTLVSTERIKFEIEKKDKLSDAYLSDLLSHLSGKNIRDACKIAQSSGDHRLALLLAQSGGSTVTRQMLQKQLEVWEMTKADKFIEKQRLKIFSILAGLLVWRTSDDDIINACDGLDWKRALALHLWYHCPSTASITEAFAEYEKAFKGETQHGEYVPPPKPPYEETDDLQLLEKDSSNVTTGSEKTFPVYDVCYHLLKLFCKRSHRLDRLLTPTTYTNDPLDHSLSWHLYQILQALGYSHLSEYHADTLHVNFACQLEEAGLWQWSVYVLLHITHEARRQNAVQELINKHVCPGQLNEIEKFLNEELQVPMVKIYKAKYLKARYSFQYSDEAKYLCKAGEWNASHKIILKHIAPDAIISECYDELYNYLNEFETSNVVNSVLDWQTGGQVFLDYIHISRTMNEFRIQADRGDNVDTYELEKLQPKVTSLCSRVSCLPTTNAKETLCQSEMAKKTANLLKTLLSLQSKRSQVSTSTLQIHVERLPMPEDYALQELQNLTRLYMLEVAGA